MIDAISYRIRIGSFNSSLSPLMLNNPILTQASQFSTSFSQLSFLFSYIVFIFYILLYLISILSDTVWLDSRIPASCPTKWTIVTIPSSKVGFVPILLLCLNALRVILSTFHRYNRDMNAVKLYQYIRYKYSRAETSLYKNFRKFLVWLAISNLLLLSECNMSINNPGPKNCLSVTYQNVQGLIPVSELHREAPNMQESKINELQAFAYMNKPDFIILNETWLKPSIADNEIFPPEAYKIFRNDRSTKTHPPDPNNPNRFRRNGGGVLIAVNSALDIKTKKIDINCPAEVLTIEVTLSNQTKFFLSTVYRVGTLGIPNINALREYYNKLLRRRSMSKVYIIGDWNFPELDRTNWESGQSSLPLDQNFLGMVSDLGLKQIIDKSTHRKGNILDLVLTNSPQTVQNLSVLDDSSFCVSDHFPITFNIPLFEAKEKTSL